MLLEAWHDSEQIIHLSDLTFPPAYCTREERVIQSENSSDNQILISMKGCFILYGFHKGESIANVLSKQDCDLGILSFQLGGNFQVREKNYDPYRFFETDVHQTFFSTKRELRFEMPSEFENFRIYLSPLHFQELLARYHGRFSTYADRIKRSESFNLLENPLPITPRMKILINEILTHKIQDPLLSCVYYETKITELFGFQLEQIYCGKQRGKHLTRADKAKMEQARQLLIRNLSGAPSIEQLARLVATNESKLKHAFKEHFGYSIYNYLLHQRVEKSIELMARDTLSLDEIAEQVGYTDVAHFSRAFKKVKGMPPGAFRKRILDR
ncbi:MAG TPA: AraC family transcriptional regulator [Prolixibacteraceae bacterium]|nr:AraC family transcriptional regulator [Prolixibacteraceae bacterium]